MGRLNITRDPRRYPPDFPEVGTPSTTPSSSSSSCDCGPCIAAGSVTGCVAIGEAPANFQVPLTDSGLIAAFGPNVVLTYVSGCTCESDAFPAVDLGAGSHTYTWKLVFAGKSVEDAVLTLEDET